jgi:hypothetical protein
MQKRGTTPLAEGRRKWLDQSKARGTKNVALSLTMCATRGKKKIQKMLGYRAKLHHTA